MASAVEYKSVTPYTFQTRTLTDNEATDRMKNLLSEKADDFYEPCINCVRVVWATIQVFYLSLVWTDVLFDVIAF